MTRRTRHDVAISATATRLKLIFMASLMILSRAPTIQAFAPRSPHQVPSSVTIQSNPLLPILNKHDRHCHRKRSNRSPRSGRVHTSLSSSILATATPPPIGAISMVLLSLQFAFQPVLTRSFASKSIQRGTYVLMQDAIRILMSLAILNRGLAAALQGWTLQSALQAAGIPSMLYLVQNICSLMAYQHLSPITYNVLNQTKTLSAAIFCYMLLGQKQSPLQMVALFLLVLAALVMEGSLGKLLSAMNPIKKGKGDTTSEDAFWTGVVPVLVASTTSGLAGALAQKSLQLHARNAMIFNMELAACSIVIMTVSKLLQSIRERLGWNLSSTSKDDSRTNTSTVSASGSETPTSSASKSSMWTGWTKQTWIPLMTNAAGGVLVGLVTKYAGAVPKGFALILGMFLSGLLQNYLPAGKSEGGLTSSKQVTGTQWLGGVLAAVSLILHVSNPPQG